MAWRNGERTDHRMRPVRSAGAREAASGPLFPFDRRRHARARALLGADAAATFSRQTTTADALDLHMREYVHACHRAEVGTPATSSTPPPVARALARLADVEDRHLVLICDEAGHDSVTLAKLVVAHRRRLARHGPTVQQALLGLSLVLLAHQLHADGRLADASNSAREAVDVLSRVHAGVLGQSMDARPALVLALEVSLTLDLACGRRVEAARNLVSSIEALADLAVDRSGFDDDLRRHVDALSDAWAQPDLDDDVRAALGALSRTLPLPWPDDPTPRRRPARPAVTARSEADDLYDDSVRLATSDGNGPAAATAAGAAVSAYRRQLAAQPADQWPAVRRTLARALWRHAVIVSELLGRPRDALGPGREALALTRRALRIVEHDDPFDDLVGELGVTLCDLSHIARTAGLVGEYDQLTEEATRLRVSDVGAGALRALGAALHSRAAEACETTVALAERDRDMRPTVSAGIHTSTQAIAVRRLLLRDDDPMTSWELANSHLAHGHLRCLNGDGQLGAEAIVDAHRTVAGVSGPAGEAMRNAAETALLAACASYPEIAVRADWPL